MIDTLMLKTIKNRADHLVFYKKWKNSSENFGATISLPDNGHRYKLYNWSNFSGIGVTPIGSKCLVVWGKDD